MVSVHPAGGALPLSGSCPLGWETALAIVTTSPNFQKCVFSFPLFIFFGIFFYYLLRVLFMLVAKWVPTPCCNDAYSVGTPKWAL